MPNQPIPARLPNLKAMLTPEEQMVRQLIMDAIVAHQRPVTLGDLGRDGRDAGLDLPPLAAALLAKKLLVRDRAGAFTGCYPVSALPTRHQVQLADGRKWSAMCAIDALGGTFVFNQDMLIRSSCSQSDAPITIRIKDGALAAVAPPTVRVLHVDLNNYGDWASAC